jgi:hypothetical protein
MWANGQRLKNSQLGYVSYVCGLEGRSSSLTRETEEKEWKFKCHHLCRYSYYYYSHKTFMAKWSDYNYKAEKAAAPEIM